MMRRFLFVGLAGILAVGCQTPGGLSAGGMREALPSASDSLGIIRITFKWPADLGRQIQQVPVAATRAEITVKSTEGVEVAVRDVVRSGSSTLAASIALAPGSGYTILAKLFDGKGDLVAEGISDSFNIQRQRVSSVNLEVSPVISLVAGTGTVGFTGDNGPATSAQLNFPLGIAVAANGDLLFVDEANHAIRRLDASGVISTVVGTAGTKASVKPLLDDSVPVADALLNSPDAVAVAPNGDLLIADTSNGAIRILPAESGNRYGRTLTADKVHTLYTTALGGSPPLRAVAVDRDGNVFIVERHRILMITPEGNQAQVAGVSATVTGKGDDGAALQSQLAFPVSLITDGSGNLLFSEIGNHRVRLVCREPGTYFGMPMASGSVYTLAGVGNLTSEAVPLGDGKDGLEASFNSPQGLALDAQGNLYIADTSNHRIRVLSPDRRISTFAGTGSQTKADGMDLGDGGSVQKATFWSPRGLMLYRDNLYVSDSANYRIRRIPL